MLFCNGSMETIEHARRDCPRSTNIWFSSPLDFRVHEVRNLGWVAWLVRLTSSLAKESFDLLLVMIWSICKGRNDFLWNGLAENPQNIHCKKYFMAAII